MLFTAEKAFPKENDLPPLPWQEHQQHGQDYPCQQGDGAAMSPLNCHMSYGNHSQKDRIGWVISFVHPEVRWQPSHAVHPFNYLVDSTANTPLQGDDFPRFSPTSA